MLVKQKTKKCQVELDPQLSLVSFLFSVCALIVNSLPTQWQE